VCGFAGRRSWCWTYCHKADRKDCNKKGVDASTPFLCLNLVQAMRCRAR
jgi:hypothetical protein